MKGDEDDTEFESDKPDIVDRLFDDTPTGEEEDIDTDKEGEDVETEEEEEDGEEDDTETGESDDDEEAEDGDAEEEEEEDGEDVDPEDYDAPADGKKKKDKGKADDSDVEKEPENETMARKLAKENGRKFKEEAAAHQTTKLDLQREKEAREKLERDLAEAKKVKIQPMDDPEYRELHENVMTRVRESAELIDGTRNIERHFGSLVTKYLNARKAGDQRESQISALRAEIIEKCVVSDVPFDEMDEVEKAEANKAATKVMTLLRDNSDNVQKAVELARKLKEDAEEGSYVLRERDYEASKGNISPILEGLGVLSDDLIEANPHAVESIVASLIRDNPAAKTRATKLKADLTEVFAGLRPLTKAEVKKLTDEGTDIKQFEAERKRAYDAKVKKFISYTFHGVMTRSLIGPMAKELAEFKGEKQAEESEVDTLIRRNIGKKGPKKKASEKKGRATASARAALVGGEWGEDDDDD